MSLKTSILAGIMAISSAIAQAQNLTIVSIGDSLASGEGNPNSFNNGNAVWLDEPCHRSNNNGRRIAANRMDGFPNVAVTFRDFSCSGASIDAGLLGNQTTDQPDAANVTKSPQIDQVVNRFGRVPNTNRTDAVIDILMISIGVNDISFSKVVTECLLPNGVSDCTTSDEVQTARNTLQNGTLAQAFERLGVAIRERLPNVRRVYITEYPVTMKFSPTNTCGGLIIGDVSMSGVSVAEGQFLFSQIFLPLNDRVQTAAQQNGWVFIRGPEETFATHGYCTAQDRRYMNTLTDSLFRQGNENGTMHPNRDGHRAYADAIMVRATSDLNLPIDTPRLLRTVESNVGLPSPIATPLFAKSVQVEIAQHPGTLTARLQFRVLNPPVCLPFLGCTTPPAPAFANVTMQDTGTGRLNLFTASIPNSAGLLPGQTLQYRITVTGSRNGQTETLSIPTATIALGDILVQE